ncbi:MAG: hypothetical protein LBK50_03425 [Candidatus Nomurabacteria bacterium]|nr:hypothetical protein [Candidatus Nomurabacteria bacterium]
MNNSPTKPSKMRGVISKDTQQIMLFAVLTAIVVAVCLVLGVNFIEDINYNSQIIGELSVTNNTLKNNIDTTKTLDGNIEDLKKNKSLQKLRINANSSPLEVILDSMPTIDNRSALAASLQNSILSKSNISIQSINVNDSASAENATATSSTSRQTSGSVGNALPVQFSVVLIGQYEAIQTAIKDMERSIRPITIDTITINGGGELRASITATTYFSPLIDYKLGSKEVIR